MSPAPASFCVLGSGSRGNASVLRVPGGALLIDCGLSPRETRNRLERAGASMSEVRAIIVTHLDRDHFHLGWVRVLERGDAPPVHIARHHRRRALSSGLGDHLVNCFSDDAFTLADLVHVRPVPFAHDHLGTVGFVIDCGHATLGWATDLGHVPAHFVESFAGVDALGIESNYDPDLQRSSGRPPQLIARIMGGGGHLSNQQSCEAAAQIAAAGPLRTVAALHLSRDCNAPRLVRRTYEEIAPHLQDELVIASQDSPTPWIPLDRRASAPARTLRPLPPVRAAAMFEPTLFSQCPSL